MIKQDFLPATQAYVCKRSAPNDNFKEFVKPKVEIHNRK